MDLSYEFSQMFSAYSVGRTPIIPEGYHGIPTIAQGLYNATVEIL
jgi:hypothetical protein